MLSNTQRAAIMKALPVFTRLTLIDVTENATEEHKIKIGDTVIKVKDGADRMQVGLKTGKRLCIPYTWLTHIAVDVADKLTAKEFTMTSPEAIAAATHQKRKNNGSK